MNPGYKKNYKNRLRLIFVAVVGLVFLLGWVVQLLWNWLLPEILGVKSISYWQAFGILILSKILFGSFHGSGRGKGRFKDKFNQEMSQMTDDDKVRFREEWRKRFGDGCKFDR
ncbi:hypothetical protein ACK1KB_07685 [Chryseobacterium sp. TY3]